MKTKKLLAMLLVLSLVLSLLAGCGSSAEQSGDGQSAQINSLDENNDIAGATVTVELAEDAKAELLASHTDSHGRTFVTVAVEGDPGTLSPYGSGMGKVQHVIRNALFETAMCVLNDGSLAPVLATDYVALGDATYDIHFKDYIYDTEGNHLTAEDVVFSYLTGRDVFNNGNMAKIDTAEAIDDYTVRLKMTADYVGAFEKILYEGWIFTQAAYEASPDQFITTPVGTSPYRLVSWETGSEVVIEKTNNYWETDESKLQIIQKANVDVVNYKIITDEAQRVIAMQAGEVDMIHKVNFSNLDSFADDTYLIFSTLNNQVGTLFFNCSDSSPMSDFRVREAFCLAVDIDSLINSVFDGKANKCYWYGTTGSGDCDPNWVSDDYFPYDPDAAVALLEEAGYTADNPLTIEFVYEPNDKNANVCEFIQACLGAINVKCELIPVESATFKEYVYNAEKFDVQITNMAGLEPYAAPNWYNIMCNSATGSAVIAQDDDFCELLELIYTADTHTAENMQKAYDMMTERVYVYPIYIYELYTVTTGIFTTMNLRCGGREIAPQYCEYIWNS